MSDTKKPHLSSVATLATEGSKRKAELEKLMKLVGDEKEKAERVAFLTLRNKILFEEFQQFQKAGFTPAQAIVLVGKLLVKD